MVAPSGSEEGSQDGTQLCNPPMVHAMAAFHGTEQQGLTAVARGDGVVAVYKIDSEAKSTKGRRNYQRPPSSCTPIFAHRSHDAAATCV